MVDIAVSVPGDTDVVSNYPAAERASRAATLAAINGTGAWGGTSAGSTNAQTVTINLTGWSLVAGAPINFIPGFTTSSTTPTLNPNDIGPKTIVTLEDLALQSGVIVAGRLCQVLYDGSKFRLLNRINFISQTVYDDLFPVGFVQIKDNTTTPAVPTGVTATWTRISTDAYLRGATGSPGTGGSLTTGGSGTLTTAAADGTSTGMGDGGFTGVRNPHTHNISSHTHTIEPTYRSFSVWERTA